MHPYPVQPSRFVLKLCVLVALISAGTALVFSRWPGVLLGIFILAAMYAHAVELQHQCLHYTAFRSSRANRFVGRVLGLPMLVSYSHYRHSHFIHHARLGTPEDVPFFSYEPSFLRSLVGFDRYRSLVTNLGRAARGLAPAEISNARVGEQIVAEYRLLGLMIFLVLVAFLLFPAAVGMLYLLPLALAEGIHRLIELPEHYACVPSTNVLQSTRSITGSRFSFWLTNGNNLHAEHHLHPNVPIDYLPSVHEHLLGKHRYFNRTYLDFFLTSVAGVFRGTPK